MKIPPASDRNSSGDEGNEGAMEPHLVRCLRKTPETGRASRRSRALLRRLTLTQRVLRRFTPVVFSCGGDASIAIRVILCMMEQNFQTVLVG